MGRTPKLQPPGMVVFALPKRPSKMCIRDRVVDIVRFADAMAEAVKVIDGGKDIVVNDVLGNKHVDILTDSVLELSLIHI